MKVLLCIIFVAYYFTAVGKGEGREVKHGRALCLDLIPSITKREGWGEVKRSESEKACEKAHRLELDSIL